MCSLRLRGRVGGGRVAALVAALASAVVLLNVVGNASARSVLRSTTRTYVGAGETCIAGSVLLQVDCDDDNNCDNNELCSDACDRHPQCDSYINDGGNACYLHSGCNFLGNDGCDDCDVYVCLENCPSNTPFWYASRGFWRCRGGHLSKVNLDCDQREDCREECACRCKTEPDCTDFMMDSGSKSCALYDGCDTDYDEDEEWIIGKIR